LLNLAYIPQGLPLVSGQINPDWDCPQDNYMLTSSKIDI
jgi:hypothetical protein